MSGILDPYILFPAASGGGPVGDPVSLEWQQQSSPNHTSLTSDVFAPSANALVIIYGVGEENPGPGLSSVTSTFATEAGWTTIQSRTSWDGSDVQALWSAFAITTSSPGSGKVTANYTSQAGGSVYRVVEITTGFDAADPVSQAADWADTSPATEMWTNSLASAPGVGDQLWGLGEQKGWTGAGALEIGAGFTAAVGLTNVTTNEPVQMLAEYLTSPPDGDITFDYNRTNTSRIMAGFQINAG